MSVGEFGFLFQGQVKDMETFMSMLSSFGSVREGIGGYGNFHVSCADGRHLVAEVTRVFEDDSFYAVLSVD